MSQAINWDPSKWNRDTNEGEPIGWSRAMNHGRENRYPMNNYPETFEISKDGKSIKCLRCERTSHNPNDVEHRYCGFCHQFHDDIWPPAREDWIKRKPREADPGETKNMN